MSQKERTLDNAINGVREQFLAPVSGKEYPPRFLKAVRQIAPALEFGGDTDIIPFKILEEGAARKFLSLFKFLTQPRSVAEFLKLRRDLCRKITAQLVKSGGYDEFTHDILMPIAYSLGIIPGYFSGTTEVRGVEVPWFDWGKRERKAFRPENIICSSKAEADQRISSLDKHGRLERPLGLLVGKWRTGAHSEQRQTILNAAKVLRQVDGILAISVETNQSIQQRRDQSAFPLEERMASLAATPGVDIVFPVDPNSGNEETIALYYEGLWETLGGKGIDFYFVGEHNHPLFPKFAERAGKLGVNLLWDHESAGISATQLIKDLVSR